MLLPPRGPEGRLRGHEATCQPGAKGDAPSPDPTPDLDESFKISFVFAVLRPRSLLSYLITSEVGKTPQKYST